MPTVSCPSCARPLEVDDAYRDWTVRCPHCSTEFVPAEVEPAAPPPRDRRDDRYDDEYDRPRRRGREADPERDGWEREEALRLVAGPAMWLEMCGWVGGLTLAATAVLCFMIAAMQANNGNGDEIGPILTGLFSGFLALPYTIVMVVGARKMRALSSYGWAVTAAIGGITSFAFMCCLCSPVSVGFGIWGLMTLNNPIVQRAFNRNDYAPRHWDD